VARIRRRGNEIGDPPESDYREYLGESHVGIAHGLMQPYDLSEEEIEEYLKEHKERQARKIPPGFGIT